MNTGLALTLLVIGIIVGAVAGAYMAPSRTVTVTSVSPSPTTIVKPVTVTSYRTETTVSVSTRPVTTTETTVTTSYKTVTMEHTNTIYTTVTETETVARPEKPYTSLYDDTITLDPVSLVSMPVVKLIPGYGYGDALLKWEANDSVWIKVWTGYLSSLDNYTYGGWVAMGEGRSGVIWFPYLFDIVLNIGNNENHHVTVHITMFSREMKVPTNVDLSYLGYVRNGMLPPGNGTVTISNGINP